MKPKMLLTIFLILLIMSFMPIYPNPKKKIGLNKYNPLCPARVNMWKSMS